MDEEKQNKKWMTVSLGSSLASEGVCLFVDLWEAQPCHLGDPRLPQVRAEACISLQAN